MSARRLGFLRRGKPQPKPSAPVEVTLDGITMQYPAGREVFPAVSDVSLDIRAGELTALMGPSGSGKTTLLSIMGGILRPSAGRVAICGEEVGDMDEEERSRVRLAHVGFVFQNYNLFPTLTARQNIELALDLRGIKGRLGRRRADELLEQMELNDKRHSYPADLSGGQKQRIAIARALAGAPNVILADEPTAALDSQNGRVIMTIFRDLARHQGRAVVVVTHDSRISDFVDRTILIEDGRIKSDIQRSPELAERAALTANIVKAPRTIEWAVAP